MEKSRRNHGAYLHMSHGVYFLVNDESNIFDEK